MTTKISGLVSLDAFLASLPANLETNVLRGALRAGAEVIADGAREECRSDEVRATIKIRVRAEPGGIVAKVVTEGPGAYKAPWLEHGTDPHFISVDPEISGGRTARRVNRLNGKGDGTVAEALVIEGKVVGATVHHPGAKSHPFMRTGADKRETAAIEAVGGHIAKKLTKQGLVTPDPEVPEE